MSVRPSTPTRSQAVVIVGAAGIAFAAGLKARILPPSYWQAMLNGHEWMAKPALEGS